MFLNDLLSDVEQCFYLFIFLAVFLTFLEDTPMATIVVMRNVTSMQKLWQTPVFWLCFEYRALFLSNNDANINKPPGGILT